MAEKRPIIVIKKKGGHGGHHGGAWKVAYADFVTAMMALFIVLWLLNSTPQVKKAVAGYFQDPKSSMKETGIEKNGDDQNIPIDRKNVENLKEQIEKAIHNQKDLEKLAKQIEITIPEGMDRWEIGERLASAGLGTAQGFLEATQSEVSRIRDLDSQAMNLEGYLFPDTYRFGRHATDVQMAEAMVRRFRAEAVRLGLTTHIHEIVTLASLVEKETAVPEERPLVASVLVNRLAKGMPLMTDPAVIYGLRASGQWRGAIYASDLSEPDHDTAYNTYRHAGLPPGPISNPGAASLSAAMHPAKTDYLYFVAAGDDPQGHSRFAETLDEHQKNVAIYRKAMKQTGKR